jgi:hypothetical protein
MAAVTFPRRFTSAAATVSVSGLPSWVPSPGQYANASTQNARVIDNGPGAWSGTQGFGAIWGTWNSGAYAPTLGVFGSMLYFGGGHDGYFGNEIVRLDLSTRAWSYQRTRSPVIVDLRYTGDTDSVNVAINTFGEWSDGTPYPNHTNNAADFLPPDMGGGTLGSFIFMGHDNSNVNITVKHLWRCDLATGVWTRYALSWPDGGPPDLMHMAVDTNRKLLWVGAAGINQLYAINPLNGYSVTRVDRQGGGGFGPQYFVGMCYNPARDFLVITTRNDASGAIRNENLIVVNLSGYSVGQTTAPAASMIYTGTACPSLWGGQSVPSGYQRYMAADCVVYSSYDSSMYAVDHYTTGPCRLYRLVPPAGNVLTGTWTWTNETLTAKAGEPFALRNLPYSETDDSRLLGRMRYVPPLKSLVFCDTADKPAQALRHSSFI